MTEELTYERIKEFIGDIDIGPLEECIEEAYESASLLHQAVQKNPKAVGEALSLDLVFDRNNLVGYGTFGIFMEKDPDLSGPISNFLDDKLKTCYSR